MKARELIKLLSSQDPDAEVLVSGFGGAGYSTIAEVESTPVHRFTQRPPLWSDWDRAEPPYYLGVPVGEPVPGLLLHGEAPTK